jgi:hypothetical protein
MPFAAVTPDPVTFGAAPRHDPGRAVPDTTGMEITLDLAQRMCHAACSQAAATLWGDG